MFYVYPNDRVISKREPLNRFDMYCINFRATKSIQLSLLHTWRLDVRISCVYIFFAIVRSENCEYCQIKSINCESNHASVVLDYKHVYRSSFIAGGAR